MSIEIHVLGVGEAFDPERPNSASVIKAAGYYLLIDCGTTVPPLLWREYPEPDIIDAIYFTHLHPDHCFGLGPMLIWWMGQGRQKPLKIYTTRQGRNRLEDLIRLALWGISETTTFPIEWSDIKEVLRIGPFAAKFAKTSHSVPNFSIRLEHKNSTFFYSGDGVATAASKELMKNTDLCFQECYSVEEDIVHFYVEPCLRMAEELNLSDMRLYHLSVRDCNAIREAIAHHPCVQLANPGDRFQI